MKESIIKQFVPLFLASLLTMGIVLSQLSKFPEFKNVPDAEYYILMAEGRPEKALLPYASRVLHPWIISKFRILVGTDAAFITVGTLSLFLFLAIILNIFYSQIRRPILLCIVLIFIPSIFLLYNNLYRPNLFFTAISSIYWYFLIRKKHLMSLLILFLLFLTRKESMVIAFIFILALLIELLMRANKKALSYIFGTLAVWGLGYAIVSYLTRHNVNMHHMGTLFFLAFKFICGVVLSLTGFSHWVDTYQVLPYYTHTPWIVWDSPQWIRSISHIRQFGIYEWSIMSILRPLLFLVSLFGTGPAILLYFIKQNSLKGLIKTGSLAFNTILLYGIAMFILAPCIGPSFRFYLNAWPVFFLIMPFFLRQVYQADRGMFMRIMLCYAASSWLFVLSLNEMHTILFFVLKCISESSFPSIES